MQLLRGFPTFLVVPLLILGSATSSCKSKASEPLKAFWGDEHPAGRGLTSDQLAARLQEFTFQFSGALQQTCLEMCAGDDDIELRRRTILWRSRMVPEVRRAANYDNTFAAFVDTWTLCMQQKLYLKDPENAQFFGDHTPVAEDVATALEQDIEQIGAAFMRHEDLARLREDIRNFSLEHPLKGGWSRQGNLPSTSDQGLGWAIRNPLSGLNPFSGLDASARAVMEFNKVADDFKNMVGHMPEELSWKLELLVTDLEERGRTRELTESMDQVAQASVSLADTAAKLPEETRQVITHTFDELGEQYAPLQTTLAESRATMAELNGAIQNADHLVTSLDATLDKVARAGEAWEAVGLAFASDEENAGEPADPDAPSFAQEYDVAAQSITAAAIEIRGIIADMRALAESGEDERVIEAANTASRGAIDHAAWRGIQLIGVALIAGLAYQLAKKRIQRGS